MGSHHPTPPKPARKTLTIDDDRINEDDRAMDRYERRERGVQLTDGGHDRRADMAQSIGITYAQWAHDAGLSPQAFASWAWDIADAVLDEGKRRDSNG
jgi:hypothetical protein